MNYFFLFVILFSLTLSACSNSKIVQEVHLNKSSVSAAGNKEWSYTGKTGPNYWSSINKEYALCSNGKQQSPVNIDQTIKKSLPLGINYHYDLFKIERSHYTVKFIPVNHSNSINLNGTIYILQQFHFHTPSEHTINGKQSDLEIHFINQNKKKSIITIGVLVNSGRLNKEFQKILNVKPIDEELGGKVVKLNLQSFIPYTSKKVSYTGSFTTPPCTEGIKWIVFYKPIQFSEEQIHSYQNYFDPNSRPVQPLNGRDLFESW
ncbi:carbonic anhydrase [Gottfriedia acidiceleris]|uniref:carbonic anhydrase n=1 Tax=Gottfriedia acidiceleris TaxID=371036 RepID=UPI00142F4C29|nr:carbonic anhydrase family protein [Gottfriedia acidiceleris]